MTGIGRSATLALALLASATAHAATLRLRDGGQVVVVRNSASMYDLGPASSSASSADQGFRYTVSDRFGRTWGGFVPGTSGPGMGDPTLAQDPMTGAVLLIVPRPDGEAVHLQLASWTGQTWTDFQAITHGDGLDGAPVISFRSAGDALLAWSHQSSMGDSSVLLLDADLSPAGVERTFTYASVSSPERLLEPVTGPTGLADGVAGLMPSTDGVAAYLFLGSGQVGAMALMRLDLSAIYEGGGANTPPVPVTFAQIASSHSAEGPVGTHSGGPSGQLINPWRMLMGDSVVYYWTAGSSVEMVMFRGGTHGALQSLTRPASDDLIPAQVYQAAMRMLAVRRPNMPSRTSTSRR